MKLATLIPEFPGQTHIWMWREIVCLRDLGADVTVFSTRRPDERARARHAFAQEAQRRAVYLWPMGAAGLLVTLAWAVLTRPVGLLRCVKLGLTLPVDEAERPAWKTVLPLLLPACRLARELKRRDIGHLHVHSCKGGAVLAMMNRRLTGIPFSLTLNADIEWWGGAMAEKFGDAAFTIAITEWLLAQMRDEFPRLREDQALLGRIGVDTQKWTPRPERARQPEDPARLISVGRLHPSKGFDLLLEAVATLRRQGRAVTLTLIGDGPQRDELTRMAGELGLSEHVEFTGSVSEDEIIERMAGADVFVLSSHREPLGVVTMEAMSMAVPAVATDAGGVGEIITDGVDGLLVPPHDASAIATAVAGLLDDPDRAAQLGRAGRQRIVDAFDALHGARTLWERLGELHGNTGTPDDPETAGGGVG